MSVLTPEVRGSARPAPVAERIGSPGWRNPRLLAGLLLLLTSIVVGARVMAAADHTIPVYAARVTLPTGSALDDGNVVVVRMRLSGTAAEYLGAGSALPAGQVLVRPVGAGEVIPVAAVGAASQVRLRPVSIPLDGPAPAGLAPGGRVDIWASAKTPAGSVTSTGQTSGQTSGQTGGAGPSGAAWQAAGDYLNMQRIASSAEVSRVEAQSRSLGAGGDAVVQVLLPADTVPAVLNALANDARIAVLPILGSDGP